ncbi:MAG: sulfite exporter TauE/SafE family protein [Flavobacteriales bacterium]|nr:sulfite exporter TauE/SafE family protein [Flavobacteriales bacterium]MBK9288156.1 sulfite exporter TauE/SafE family protein [Flavobacteriales bacterium]MBL0036866.1 sulfite exporter TauE/SafE family protein [Flavobacteriales bacterium]
MSPTTIALLLLIGLAAGMLSGFVGIGGGIVMVPALVWLLGYSQHQAQGTSLGVLVLPVVFLAAWNYHRNTPLDLKAVAVIAVAFVVGGYMGSKLSLSLPADAVKKVFGVLMMVASLKLIFGK